MQVFGGTRQPFGVARLGLWFLDDFYVTGLLELPQIGLFGFCHDYACETGPGRLSWVRLFLD